MCNRYVFGIFCSLLTFFSAQPLRASVGNSWSNCAETEIKSILSSTNYSATTVSDVVHHRAFAYNYITFDTTNQAGNNFKGRAIMEFNSLYSGNTVIGSFCLLLSGRGKIHDGHSFLLFDSNGAEVLRLRY